jgi:hypothetical protein
VVCETQDWSSGGKRMRKRHACRRTRPAVLEKDHYPEKTTRHCRCRSEKQDVTLTIRRLSHLFTESLKSHWRRALSVATKERTPAPWELRRNDCANKERGVRWQHCSRPATVYTAIGRSQTPCFSQRHVLTQRVDFPL